ncbi:hypothetical protein DW712_13560 [Bacteroides intestinalis]|uniref:Uncharacterized protein n=1 Tax=Bacteroides intestinalis TaxID=329854 RepID=A0A414L952_9BACE|nr:hypothetical protein DW712_13560 [Bacteroides intestinalis]
MQCDFFHSIRFKVNKGWSTAVLLFLYPYFPILLFSIPSLYQLRVKSIPSPYQVQVYRHGANTEQTGP